MHALLHRQEGSQSRSRFINIESRQAGPEEPSAPLLVFGRSLHTTLMQFRRVPVPPDTIQVANSLLPDTNGQPAYRVSFSLTAVLRPDT